jgi:hypothetical protein
MMEFQTVIANIENTIYGKERHLVEETARYRKMEHLSGESMALYATIAFLRINIDELKRIAADLKQCAPVVIAYDHLG